MVGVKGVAQPEGVGGHTQADPEDLCSDLVVVRGDQQDQRAEPDGCSAASQVPAW